MSRPTAGRIDDPLAAAARERPDAPALAWPDGGWSYRELDDSAEELASRLAGAGLGPGDRVACLLPRGRSAVVALHAVPRCGASVAPLHTDWTEPEIDRFLRRLRPRALLCVAETAERAASLIGASGLLVRLRAEGDAGGEAPGVDTPELPTADPDELSGPAPDAEHTVLATSGTSGRARGVRLSLENHLACQRAAAARMGLGPEDRWLASLSPAHVGGVALALRAAVTGATLVLRERFDAEAFLELAEAGAVSHASLVPTMLRRVLRARRARDAPEPLRGLLVGGDAVDPGLLREALDRGWPVYPTYGLTEAASQVATATPSEARERPESVGRPLEGVEVGFDGDEIVVRGPTVALGYLGADRVPGSVVRDGRVIPRQGAETPDVAGAAGDEEDPGPLTDAEGWLHTGDAGRKDLDGRLYVTGRLSARLVTGGVTVDPSEIERVLRAHPEVADVCVVGLADEEWGERVAALIVRDPEAPEADPDDPLDEAGLAEWFGRRLAVAKRPRLVRFVDRLPRNPNGKPDRDAARELLGG